MRSPRWHRELVHNLQVLEQPGLDDEQAARLREHGALVYAESKRFDALVRSPQPDCWSSPREAALHWLERGDPEPAPVQDADDEPEQPQPAPPVAS